MQNYELIGQGIGAFFMMMGIAYAYVKGHRKADGSPPPERPPAQHEVKQALERIERASMDEQVAAQLLRAISKLIIALEAAAEALDQNTEMSGDMRGDIREVSRDLRAVVTELLRAQIDGGKR